MKTEFTKEFMTSNRGCYSREKMLKVKCVSENNITLEKLFKDLPINDFTWFYVRKCELTIEQKKRFALNCAKQVLPIFEKSNPKDLRVRECIEATELFLNGGLTKEDLLIKKDSAAYAARDASATDTASAAAYAAYAAADAAAYASYASFKKSVWEFVTSQ